MILLIRAAQSWGDYGWPCKAFFTLINRLEGWRGGYSFDFHHSLKGVSIYYKIILGDGASVNAFEALDPITMLFDRADAAQNIRDPVLSRELA